VTDRNATFSRRRVLGTIGTLCASAAVAPRLVFAADKQHVDVAVGAEHALVYLPWDLAKGLGYFDAEGLDVALTYTKGGSEAAQALASGSVDYSGNAIDHAIAAQAQGKSLVMIADFMNQPGITIVMRPGDKDKYKSFKDLKGRAVGVTTIGAATHVLAIWMAKKAGLSRDDLRIVGVGGGATMENAIAGGAVDVAFGNEPFVSQILKSGHAIPFIDLFVPAQARSALGFSNYCWTGALTRADVIAKKPEQTQKIVDALVRAQKFIATRSPAAVAAALSDELRGGLSADAWAPGLAHSHPAYTARGEIAADGVRAVVETNAYFLSGDASKVDANKLFDNSFVERARAVKV
jgi:NitT/TauT family transport system substrate-binding protein